MCSEIITNDGSCYVGTFENVADILSLSIIMGIVLGTMVGLLILVLYRS